MNQSGAEREAAMNKFFEYNDKIADAVDAWRVVPRLLVGLYGYLLYTASVWFMSLPDPTTTQAAFISTMFGAAAAIFGLYTSSGKKNG